MKKLYFSTVIILAVAGWMGCANFDKNSQASHSQLRNVSSVNITDLQAPWAYDPGPSADTAMGRELIDIVAKQPNMPGISEELTGDQKFRPAFGPTLWRMIQKPNSIKILFIGQDGTHIAEAAGRTATAGFGGRAQDMAAHFGVEVSAAFMNTYAFTIKGQYAGRNALVVSENNGQKQASFSNSVIDNGMWLMTHDQSAPMAKWRNSLIDWIMRNNKDSLRLVVLFGGSARDAVGTFIESRGAQVGARYTAEDLAAKKIKVPRFTYVSTGGNGEMPVAVTKEEKNLFESRGFKIPYTDLTLDARGEKDPVRKQKILAKIAAAEKALSDAQKEVQANLDNLYPSLAISNGGLNGSGIIHPAQIGGYDLDKIKINGKTTISLKGLKLSDGSAIQNDVLVADFPHPTSLSSGSTTAAEEKVEKSLATLKPYKAQGWRIVPDAGKSNKFDLSDSDPKARYIYGRAEIAPAYYDFGTPQNRMVSVSSAYRMPGQRNIVVIGSRNHGTFNPVELKAATYAAQPSGINPNEFFTSRPRTIPDRYSFDAGPGEQLTKLMKENLNIAVIGKMKNGQQASESCKKPEAMSNFNIKTHPLCVGDFGHYRGTFNAPKVIILADPAGLDDIVTARALTGARGQYLQALMDDMGVNDKYLVIKTVPFGMSGATDAEWKTVMGQTAQYRQKLFEAILSSNVQLVIADGKYASAEVAKLVGTKAPVVSINRGDDDNAIGIAQAATDAAKLGKFGSFKYAERMANIPRTHLGFFSRVWEGTSGTHVFSGIGAEDKGNVFAIVVPAWAYNQKNIVQDREERAGITSLNQTVDKLNLPRENEKFSAFMKRKGIDQ